MTSKLFVTTLLLSLVLCTSGCKKNALSTLSFSSTKSEKVQQHYPNKKIAVVNFLPLPDSSRFRFPVNKKVMTSEFYSPGGDPDYDEGYFIPEEYIDILHNNIRAWAEVNNIDLQFFGKLQGISRNDFDLVILGRTIIASVSDSAKLKVEILVLDGSDFRLLQRQVISQEESKRQSDPIHTPIHFIGEHNENFSVQRTLLSVTAHNLSGKIFATAFGGRTK